MAIDVTDEFWVVPVLTIKSADRFALKRIYQTCSCLSLTIWGGGRYITATGDRYDSVGTK
jgi:hypothetical protein